MPRDKKIEFTLHAKDKLNRLTEIGVTKGKILETIRNPQQLVEAQHGRRIAQGLLSESLVLRIVYEETEERIIAVTVYPGERRRYE
jgi:hypothetical protein